MSASASFKLRLTITEPVSSAATYAATAKTNSVLYSMDMTVSMISLNAFPERFIKLNFVFIVMDIPSE